ncbi:MAG: class I SAM-dependent methyltransferase [Gemmatimonadaceae bacterium]
MRSPAHYDKAYFDKWYRHPKHRVKSPGDIARQLRFIVSATEYLFEQPVRRVLDVGCGEGNWRPPLQRIRPGATYWGVDASAYAVARWGRRRNIQLGTFGTLASLALPGTFDLVLCCGVLMYVAPDELRSGLTAIRALASGVCYFEVFTSADSATGDFDARAMRPPSWWRRLFRETGFVSCGLHTYLPITWQTVPHCWSAATRSA